MKSFNKQGFTLVELIVVIIILSILASIAFFTYSQKSVSARNTLRKYDISLINKIMGTKVDINVIPLSQFIDTLSPAHTFWTGTVYGYPITATSYEVGTPNIKMFWNESVADPETGDPYIIGYTQWDFWRYYQIAGSLEISTAIVDGIYYSAGSWDLAWIIKDPSWTGAILRDGSITPY